MDFKTVAFHMKLTHFLYLLTLAFISYLCCGNSELYSLLWCYWSQMEHFCFFSRYFFYLHVVYTIFLCGKVHNNCHWNLIWMLLKMKLLTVVI